MRPDERSTESALSLCIAAIALGAIAQALANAGGVINFLGMREGRAHQQMLLVTILWRVLAPGLGVRTFGLLAGAWRLRRSLLGGRARRFATLAFAAGGAAVLVSFVSQLAWPYLVQGQHRTFFQVRTLLHLVLDAAISGCLIAAVVGLARPSRLGARLGVFAAALALEAVWYSWLFGRGYEAPVLGLAGSFLVPAFLGAAMLAILVPVRRAWRGGLAAAAGDGEGPYREAVVPGDAWRGQPELAQAATGLARVLRWAPVALVLGYAAGVALLVSRSPGPVEALAVANAVVAVIVCTGLARYTRAPFEIPGRDLGVFALVFGLGAAGAGCLASAQLVLVGVLGPGAMDPRALLPGDLSSGFMMTLLLVVSIGRAARGLAHDAVRQRATVVLWTFLAGAALVAVLVPVALLELFGRMWSQSPSSDLHVLIFIVVALGSIVWMVAFVRLLRDAAAMLAQRPSSP